MKNLQTIWETRHVKGKEFYEYFSQNKASAVRETMTAGVQSMCGLGFPPDVYTQNTSESINKVVKEEDKDDSSLRRKKKSISDIVEWLRKLVQRQEEQFLAVLGEGEYKIVHDFQHLEVGDNYYRMTAKQKTVLRKKFFACSRNKATPIHLVTESENLEVENQVELSVAHENSQILSLPFTILKELFSGASHLLKCQNGLAKSLSTTLEASGPNKVDLWFVASEDSSKPHSVQVVDSGRITCDEQCIRWARHNICSHSIAVAEKNGMLLKYPQWFRNRRKTGILTKMAEVRTPKCSGQKNKATQRRKGRSQPNIAAIGAQTTFLQQSRTRADGDKNDQLPNSNDHELAAETATVAPGTKAVHHNTAAVPSLLAQLDTISQPAAPLPLSLPLDLVSSNSMAHVQTLKPDPPPGLVEVILLHLCDPRVTICHGCSQPIRSAGGCIPPPADLVVVTKMQRDYLPAGERRQGKLGNV